MKGEPGLCGREERKKRRGRPLTPGTWKGAEVLGNEGAGGEGTPNSAWLKEWKVAEKWTQVGVSFLAASTPSKSYTAAQNPLK